MTSTVNPFGKILVYIDGSESSITAAQFAIALSKGHGTLLKVVYVVNDNLLTELLGAKIFVEMEKMDYERDLEEDGKRKLNYVVEARRQERREDRNGPPQGNRSRGDRP